MIVGGAVGSAPGRTQDHVLNIEAQQFAGNSILAKMKPVARYRDHYFAPYINGVYIGNNVKSHFKEDISLIAIAPSGSSTVSVYFEDAGRIAAFTDRSPSTMAELIEALTATRIQFSWTCNYELTAPVGDTSLDIVSVSGAKRAFNVEVVPNKNTRGRLYYSISSDGTTHTIRFWSYDLIVASGSRIGDGSIVCNQENNSGLSLTANLTYSADVTSAYFDLRWPSAYQIHYSTVPLTFPRTPQGTLQDAGVDSYLFLSPSLPSGTYYYNVLQVDDAGNVQDSDFLTPDPITINATPDPATNVILSIVTVSGKKYVQIDFDIADPSITHNVYVSPNANDPIDFTNPLTMGSLEHSKKIAILYPDTETGLPTINPADVDYTSFYTTLLTAFDSAVTSLNTAYDAGETGFVSSFTTIQDSINNSIGTYESALFEDFSEFQDDVLAYGSKVIADAQNVTGLGLSTDDWKIAVRHSFGTFIAFCGAVIAGDSGRYHFSDGSVLSNDDGSAGAVITLKKNLFEAGKPFVEYAAFRSVVRSVQAGLEEQSNNEITITLNPDGSIRYPVPNTPFVKSESLNGLEIDILGAVNEDSYEVLTDTLFCWFDSLSTPLDSDNISSSQVISSPIGDLVANQHSALLSTTVSTAGHYHYVLRSSANGQLSNVSETFEVYIAPVDGVNAVQTLSAKIIRGK